MLKLKGITKDYTLGEETVHALKGIDLEFRKSEFVAILGHSGCGKTTLLNIIGGLDSYTSGDLVINGKSTKDFTDRDWDSYRNHSIGFVFQSYNLIPHQTVLSNVELALTLSGVSADERRQRAIDALNSVGLGDQLNKKPNQMSGGQMQRVAIARALVNNPDILLADEPTGALDSDTSVQIMEILKEISKDKLIIMVTHNPELADSYASRIIKLKDGLITGDSDPYSGESEDGSAITFKKTAMSYLTALNLSLNNLMTKKGRTILTAFAGSIGIIGIALILSISTGVNNYIDRVQEDTLTSYPITIQAEEVDMTSLMENLMGLNNENGGSGHSDDAVYANNVMLDMLDAMSATEVNSNNLHDFKLFLDKEMSGEGSTDLEEHASCIQYSYNLPLNLYTMDGNGQIVKSDAMSLLSDLRANVIGEDAEASVNSSITSMMSYSSTAQSSTQLMVWQEMLAGDGDELINDVVKNQYELLYGSWPESYNEVVLIVDENNEVSDLILYALGLKSADEMMDVMASYVTGEEVKSTGIESWSYEDICSQEFRLIHPADCYMYDDASGSYVNLLDSESQLQSLYSKGIELKISGIVRQDADSVSGMMSGAIGYTAALVKELVSEAESKELVAKQLASPDTDIFTGLSFKTDDSELTEDDIKAAVDAYIANASTSTKASIYVACVSTAPDELVESMVEQQTDGLDRSAIEAMVTQSAPEYADTLSSMSDDTLMAFVKEMIRENVKASYAQQTESSMRKLSDAELAQNFESFYISPENYKMIYSDFVNASYSNSSYAENLRKLGYVDMDNPAAINIYVSTFADKDAVSEIIEDYNSSVSEDNRIEYTDYVALIMSSVTTIINVISYVLIAFVAISLIVSSIMIGIITYISVLERTKEIGILRAIGASKKDIYSVFNAETIIIGFAAGLIGILSTVILCIPINIIVRHLTGIQSLRAVLPFGAAILLVIISMGLTVVAGLIPSKVAAEKDPVEALRTE